MSKRYDEWSGPLVTALTALQNYQKAPLTPDLPSITEIHRLDQLCIAIQNKVEQILNVHMVLAEWLRQQALPPEPDPPNPLGLEFIEGEMHITLVDETDTSHQSWS